MSSQALQNLAIFSRVDLDRTGVKTSITSQATQEIATIICRGIYSEGLLFASVPVGIPTNNSALGVASTMNISLREFCYSISTNVTPGKV